MFVCFREDREKGNRKRFIGVYIEESFVIFERVSVLGLEFVRVGL